MKSKIKTISLFSGCGGLDLGFEASNFDVLFASDIFKEAAETLRHNNPNTFVFGPPYFSGDVSEIDVASLESLANIKGAEIDMIIGGPPCQPFSVAAAQRFLKSDTRFKRKGFESEKGQLIFEYLRLIKEIKPKAFLIENVPGILKIDGGKTIDNLKDVLKDLGYTVNVAVLDAANYGVPQNRKRAIIVGNLLGIDFQFPTKEPLLGNKGFSQKTVAQALANIPATITNNETRKHSEESIERYKKLLFGQRDPQGRVDRLNPDLPSKTIIAGGTKGGGRSHLHPFLARTLSVRECARLQTFPDNFEFKGNTARQFTQVGNAVPPLLAEVLARAIGEQIFKMDYKNNPTLMPTYFTQAESTQILAANVVKSSYRPYLMNA